MAIISNLKVGEKSKYRKRESNGQQEYKRMPSVSIGNAYQNHHTHTNSRKLYPLL